MSFHLSLARRGLKPLPVLEHFAERLAAIGEGTEDNYLTVLSKKLKAHNVKVPSVVIEYTGLSVETQALIGSAGIPTVGNQFLNLIKVGNIISQLSKLAR